MEEADIKWFKNAKLNITKTVWTGILTKEEIRQLSSGNLTILKKRLSILPIKIYMKEYVKWPMY